MELMTGRPGPVRSNRKGVSTAQLPEIVPDKSAACARFGASGWPDCRKCPRCNSDDTYECKHKTKPYRCITCGKSFCIRTGTPAESSQLPLKIWVWAIYLEMSLLKGVPSINLHRDVKVMQNTAWFMLQSIRAAFSTLLEGSLDGPVKADETNVGGEESNEHECKKLKAGRGTVVKAVVAWTRDRKSGQLRTKVVESKDASTLRQFVYAKTEVGARVYTANPTDNAGTVGVRHKKVHVLGRKWVDGMAHTNGLESLWNMFKTAYHGTCHYLGEKHLKWYVQQLEGKHNVREIDTLVQMQLVVEGLVEKRD